MQHCQWQHVVLSLLVIGGLTVPGWAQDGSAPAATTANPVSVGRGRWNRSGFSRGPSSFERRLRTLGLTPEQLDAVHGILAQQREQFRALREETDPKYASILEQTDSKIRTMLNPEQQQKFDKLVAQQKAERAQRRLRSSPQQG